MPSELIITRRAATELAGLIANLSYWASQTIGGQEAERYISEVESDFDEACARVVERPLLFPRLHDDVLARHGYRRFLVKNALVCIYRVLGEQVVLEHVFSAKSDYLRLKRWELASE